MAALARVVVRTRCVMVRAAVQWVRASRRPATRRAQSGCDVTWESFAWRGGMDGQPDSPRSPCTAPLSVKRASAANGVNRSENFFAGHAWAAAVPPDLTPNRLTTGRLSLRRSWREARMLGAEEEGPGWLVRCSSPEPSVAAHRIVRRLPPATSMHRMRGGQDRVGPAKQGLCTNPHATTPQEGLSARHAVA